ncbi:MAG TPA: nuclear transport factor 2 family protein [Ktedonosporobacter sp.]|nr:nuclear transport factor 2 family protein [Ktedonosporobacter sp.]
MTVEHLQEFIDAWVRRDVEAVMTFIAEDCVYETAIGPEPGQTYRGRAAIQQKFTELLADEDDGELQFGPITISGDRGAQEWAYTETGADGRTIKHRGCDLFEFIGDKIRHKNVFRKTFQ